MFAGAPTCGGGGSSITAIDQEVFCQSSCAKSAECGDLGGVTEAQCVTSCEAAPAPTCTASRAEIDACLTGMESQTCADYNAGEPAACDICEPEPSTDIDPDTVTWHPIAACQLVTITPVTCLELSCSDKAFAESVDAGISAECANDGNIVFADGNCPSNNVHGKCEVPAQTIDNSTVLSLDVLYDYLPAAPGIELSCGLRGGTYTLL